MIFIILLLFVSLCCASNPLITTKQLSFRTESAPTILTMERAVEFACQHRPDVKALKELEQAYRMQANATWGGYLPTADVSAEVSKWRGQSWPTVNMGLSVKQPIFDPSLSSNYSAARSDTERQKMVTEATLLEIRHAVEVEFLKAWQLQQQEEAIQSLYTSSEVVFKEAQHKNKECLLDATEVMKSNAEHASDVATFHSYHDDLNIEQRKLEFLLGYSVRLREGSDGKKMNLSWGSQRDVQLHDLHWYIKHAIKGHPALKEILKRIETEQHRVRSLQMSASPRIDLVAGAGTQSEDVYDDTHIFHRGRSSYYNVGVRVGLNVFDGLVSNYSERAAHARVTYERCNYDQKLNEIRTAVEGAFYTLSKSMTSLHAGKIEFNRGKNEFERRKHEFDAGLISPVDYKVAKTAWEKARFQLISLRVDVAIKEHDLLYACGYPTFSELETKKPKLVEV